MFKLLYDLGLIIFALGSLPKLLWQRVRYGKYRDSLAERLGLRLPCFEKKGPLIWIQAVSVGETRAAAPLCAHIHNSFPHATLIVSSITETGHGEAKRNIEAAAHFFLPLDLSFLVRRFVRRLKPDILILLESEIWPNLISEVKKRGGEVYLVSARISARSARRWKYLPPFLRKKAFGSIDHFCVQNSVQEERFAQLGIKPQRCTVTGNLKLDHTPQPLSATEQAYWRAELGILPQDRVVAIGSTHAPEEERLLAALEPVWQKLPTLKVLLAPRHPERFAAVAEKLRNHPCCIYSQKANISGKERIILIDAMGLLPTCYQLAEVAIVGGSFEKGIGGHNIFEPILYGTPVLFGPHMEAQEELATLVSTAGAGRSVTLSQIAPILLTLLQFPPQHKIMQKNALKLASASRGSAKRTWDKIYSFRK